ncbi:hypothetical protein [Caballeronia telluris]|uniref:Uncharacterized protein n=1 Tax=Caballeronia telluris TaxID=326475 RepID=A0A158K0W3_9BURK|nr:hypothetical protein [Caballeronia telluris]SAL74100.1 hypothetical protein AWB66_04953 [Caballeronia telluris]
MSSQTIGSVLPASDTPLELFMHEIMLSEGPCAILDRAGVVTKTNLAFESVAPASKGRPLTASFMLAGLKPGAPPDELIADSPVEALYRSPTGALVPASLHALYRFPESGDRLLLVADVLQCGARNCGVWKTRRLL